MNLDEIKNEWLKDSQVNTNDINLETIRTSSLHAKYISEVVFYKKQQLKLEDEYAISKKDKLRYYSGFMGKDELEKLGWEQYNGRKLLKDEMQSFIIGDEDLQLISKRIDYCKISIYLLEGILKDLYGRNYMIKNYIENRKFEAGF